MHMAPRFKIRCNSLLDGAGPILALEPLLQLRGILEKAPEEQRPNGVAKMLPVTEERIRDIELA